MGEIEDAGIADIDTAPTGDAVGTRDDRTGVCLPGIEGRRNHLGLRADSKAITAVSTRRPVSRTDSGQTEAVDKPVESAHRANVPTPAVFCHKEIEQKYSQYGNPADAHAE